VSDGEQGIDAGGGMEQASGQTGAGAIAASGASEASWRDALPETLRGDPSLANFGDISALAQGYIETKRAATSRVPDFSSEAGLKSFADAVRPADAAAYDIPVPEGEASPLADNFRQFAHQTGMPPAWAKATAEFFNAQSAAMAEAETAASVKEVDSLKGQMGAGPFGAKLEAVQRMLPQLGVQLADEDLARLDAKIGSGNLLKFMFAIHDRVGDPGVVEGDGVRDDKSANFALTPDRAKAEWDAKQKNADWRKAAKVEGSPENREFKRLQGLITAGRANPRK
jgi:hypothetical protein